MKTVLKYIPEVLNICEKIGFIYRLSVYTETNYLVAIYDNNDSCIVNISGSIYDGSDIHQQNATILRRFIDSYNDSWLSDSDYIRKYYPIHKLSHDINGNPRYFVGYDAFVNNKGYTPNVLAHMLGAKKYLGSLYGSGYVFTTCKLDTDLSNLCRLAGHRE